MAYILPPTELLKIQEVPSKEENSSTFIFEPLSPGFGVMIGNSLRRILLSSLEGAAIGAVKISGISHEFSTIPGVKEDVIELILNLKLVRLKLHSDEPTSLVLEKKGPGKVLASDFKKNAQVEIVNPSLYLATLDKKATLSLEATVEKGRGYLPVEKRRDQKLPIGTIAIDAIFTPIRKIHYEIENVRVGAETNFDKLILNITTDGTITPLEALTQTTSILIEHFQLILDSLFRKKIPAKEKVKIKEKKNEKIGKKKSSSKKSSR